MRALFDNYVPACVACVEFQSTRRRGRVSDLDHLSSSITIVSYQIRI